MSYSSSSIAYLNTTTSYSYGAAIATTLTSVYTSPQATSTILGDGDIPRVLVQTPLSYTTSTAYYAGPLNTVTLSAASGMTTSDLVGTVLVYEPWSYTTTTSYYNGQLSTYTLPALATQATNSVIVYAPETLTTTTSFHVGALSTTTLPMLSGPKATVVVEKPYSYTTLSKTYGQIKPSTTTVLAAGPTATVYVYTHSAFIQASCYGFAYAKGIFSATCANNDGVFGFTSIDLDKHWRNTDGHLEAGVNFSHSCDATVSIETKLIDRLIWFKAFCQKWNKQWAGFNLLISNVLRNVDGKLVFA